MLRKTIACVLDGGDEDSTNMKTDGSHDVNIVTFELLRNAE
jgi:hypothetical protein